MLPFSHPALWGLVSCSLCISFVGGASSRSMIACVAICTGRVDFVGYRTHFAYELISFGVAKKACDESE